MRILVVAPQPFFTPRGTPFSVYYRTLLTSELGGKIDFLTYGQGQDVAIPNVRFYRIPDFKFFGDIKIGPSALKLFLDVFIVLWMIFLCIRNRYDIVHAHEESVFVARFLKPIFRFKLVYDMHSSLPQQLENFKFSKSKLLLSTFRFLEDSSLKHSDAIITICPALFDYVNTVISDPDKHFLIENSIYDPVKTIEPSSSQLKDGKQSSDSNELGQEDLPFAVPRDRALIVYAGTLEEYQGIDLLLGAFQQLQSMETSPPSHLLIVGGTPTQVGRYRKTAEDLGLSATVTFTGRVAPTAARSLNQKADILVSPRSAGTNTPLKIYEQLDSGVPLVATAIYSHTQVLDSDVAFLAEPTISDFAEKLNEALVNPDKAMTIASNAKCLYESKYSRVIYKKKLESLFQSLR